MIKHILKGAILGPFLLSSLAFSETPSKVVDHATLEKGRILYVANCLRCHNKDPNERGSIGPEIADAPYEVMYSKIMTGKYPDPLPEGYVPKRTSRAMMPIPRLKEDIPAIWHYVQSLKKK